MKDLIISVKKIREHLQDNLSKAIFDNRLLFALTADKKYINRIIMSLPQKSELDAAIEKCKKDLAHLVLWGAGNDLLILSELYPDFAFQYLCDKDVHKQQTGWRGIPVMSPDELIEKRSDFYVAVNTSAFHKEIVQFLKENGFKENQIIDLGEITDSLYSAQYFDADIMTPQKGEVFIDGGCFDCSTDKAFAKWCDGDYRKIYAFEPDAENYEKCLERCRKEKLSNVVLYNKGLWDCETELAFEAGGGQGSRIGENGGNVIKIETAAIDDVVGEDEVSFIKLDVEGAELKALQGAERTIRAHRPRLAICIYHKPEDVIEILEYILSLHNDYKLYIRHYQMSPCETIVYAV